MNDCSNWFIGACNTLVQHLFISYLDAGIGVLQQCSTLVQRQVVLSAFRIRRSAGSHLSSTSSMSGADAGVDLDDYGLREACGLFGCVSMCKESTEVDVAHIVHLGLVGVQHR